MLSFYPPINIFYDVYNIIMKKKFSRRTALSSAAKTKARRKRQLVIRIFRLKKFKNG